MNPDELKDKDIVYSLVVWREKEGVDCKAQSRILTGPEGLMVIQYLLKNAEKINENFLEKFGVRASGEECKKYDSLDEMDGT